MALRSSTAVIAAPIRSIVRAGPRWKSPKRVNIEMNANAWHFPLILLITLAITYWAANRTSTTADFYPPTALTAGTQKTALRLAGDWCSAAGLPRLTGLTRSNAWTARFMRSSLLVAFCTRAVS